MGCTRNSYLYVLDALQSYVARYCMLHVLKDEGKALRALVMFVELDYIGMRSTWRWTYRRPPR